MIEQRVTLRYGAQQIPAIVQAVQGDTGRDVIFELADYEIPAGATANYYIDKPDGNAVYNSAEVISSTEILAHMTEQALAAPGRNNGQVRILSDGEVITSFDFVLEVEAFRGILRLQSETEINIFDQAIEDAVNTATEEAVAEIQAQTPVVTGMQNSIAPTYSSSSTYEVGDYVMYNAQLYRCVTAVKTAEAWTAAHWTQVPLANDVNDLKSDLIDITGIAMISFAPNGYIYTAGSIGSAISLTPTSNNSFSYAIVPAVANDIFCINGTGVQNAYLWTFIDEENKILTRANINTTGTDLYITAPENSEKLVINSTTATLGKCFKGESIARRIGKIDVVGNGKQHRLIAGVIRNSGSGWEFITDSGHQGDMNCVSVTSNSNGQIVIDYSGINATKVISLLVAPDETFAARGYLCGSSVGDDKAYLEIYKYAPSCVSGLIDCNNSGEITISDPTGGITSAVWNSNNTMTVNHKNVGNNSVPIAIPYWYSTTIPRLYSKSSTNATFQFLKISNGEFALADEVKGNLSFAFTRTDQESLALIKQDANNVVAANGNFWFIGIFQTD